MKTIAEITIFLAACIVLSLLANGVSPSGIPLLGQWDTSKGVVRAGAPPPSDTSAFEIGIVSDARKTYDRGETIFVDARSDTAYAEGHVKGAISLPVGEFEQRIDDFWDRYPVDQPIITYCSGRSCDDSHRLAQLLLEFGYARVSIMIDGFPGWKAGGHPIE